LALWEARRGHCWRCSLSGSWRPRIEEVTQRSWGLTWWKEPMRSYLWMCSPVAAEDISVLEMPVPWDDHQEQPQQWSTGSWNLEDKVCATKSRAGEWRRPWRSPEDCKLDPRHWMVGVWFLLLIVTEPWYFLLLKENSIIVEPTVKRLLIVKRLWILTFNM
jgi:hypothetical protein